MYLTPSTIIHFDPTHIRISSLINADHNDIPVLHLFILSLHDEWLKSSLNSPLNRSGINRWPNTSHHEDMRGPERYSIYTILLDHSKDMKHHSYNHTSAYSLWWTSIQWWTLTFLHSPRTHWPIHNVWGLQRSTSVVPDRYAASKPDWKKPWCGLLYDVLCSIDTRKEE